MPFWRWAPSFQPSSIRNNQDRQNANPSHPPRLCRRASKEYGRPPCKNPCNARRPESRDSCQQLASSALSRSPINSLTREEPFMGRQEVQGSNFHAHDQKRIYDQSCDEDSSSSDTNMMPDMISIPRYTEGNPDPFGQIKIPMNSERYALLQYFITTFLPLNLGPGNKYMFPCDPKTRIDLVRDCLSAPVHTYALLTAASSRIRYFGGNIIPEAYAYLTIRHLRHQFSTGDMPTQPLLFSIALLRVHAVYDGKWKVADDHDKLLAYLVDMNFGGFANLGPSLQRMLWYADRSQAAATIRKPIFEFTLRLNPLPDQLYNQIRRSLSRLDRQPMGQALLELHAGFDQNFQHLLDETIRLAHLLQYHWSDEEPHLCRDLLIARGFELLDKLHYADEVVAHSGIGFKLQRCLRIALIIWLTLTIHPMSFILTNVPVHRQPIRVDFDSAPLQQSLMEVLHCCEDQPPSIEETQLLLWIAAVGVLAFKAHATREWFVRHLQLLWADLAMSRKQTSASICDGYLWLEHIELCRGIDVSALLTGSVEVKLEA